MGTGNIAFIFEAVNKYCIIKKIALRVSAASEEEVL